MLKIGNPTLDPALELKLTKWEPAVSSPKQQQQYNYEKIT